MTLFRWRDPGSDTFDGWHASIASNAAATAASYVSQNGPCILVNDNFVTDEFVRKVVEHGQELLAMGPDPRKLHGLFFRHPNVGSTTGRIGEGELEDFYKVGGYLEDMGPSGYQGVPEFAGFCPANSGTPW